jgi:Zn-dependent protease with chaperone function
MHRAQIDNRLKGVDLYLSGGEELVAYTYGGLFIKPRIVISKIFLSSGWNAQLASVLLHELNHIERKDTFWLLILHGYDVIIRNSLKLLLFIVTLLGKIPLIGMIAIPFLFLIQMMKEIWGMVLGFGNIISRKSEEYADTESHSLVRSFYLVEALRDVLNGKIRHYTFKNDEEIVRVIYDEEHTNIDENEGFFKSLFDLKSSHPSFKNRVTIAATYSDALLTKSVKETWRIQSIIILIIVLLPFGYIICDEILKTVEYKFNNKEVVEYIQYLERKNED